MDEKRKCEILKFIKGKSGQTYLELIYKKGERSWICSVNSGRKLSYYY